MTVQLPEPPFEDAAVAVAAPAPGPGSWVGAAHVLLAEGTYWLAYRQRHPEATPDGRGVRTVLARSSDGVCFTTVAEVGRDRFDCASFERPALARLPDGRWRLYLSCATRGSKHWWVDSLTADSVAALPDGDQQVVVPGNERVGVKDPVVRRRNAGSGAAGWEMWLCCHPLTEPGEEDRMTTRYLTSDDGLAWTDEGEVLSPTAGTWDARGARLTTVLQRDPLVVLYDGRPDAASNFDEITGLAREVDRRLVTDGRPWTRSPHAGGAWRYATTVAEPDGRTRFYVEAARPDGAHDLVTFVR